MKVRELMEFLSKVDPELPVCASEEAAVYSHKSINMVGVYNGPHFLQYEGPLYRMDKVEGPFVLIGDFGDFITYDYINKEVKV